MSAKLSPEWRLNQGFDTQKESPFHLNRGVPSKEVIDTKIMGGGGVLGPKFVFPQWRCPKGEVPLTAHTVVLGRQQTLLYS